MDRDFILNLQLFANGSENYVWSCPVCNQRNPDRSPQFFVPSDWVRQQLSDAEIATLPVIMPDFSNRCARCGSRTCELHHWAPTAIFGKFECENWPKDYLCKDCHDLWHMKVTPQLVK